MRGEENKKGLGDERVLKGDCGDWRRSGEE